MQRDWFSKNAEFEASLARRMPPMREQGGSRGLVCIAVNTTPGMKQFDHIFLNTKLYISNINA
jgi:hypothetical protein